MNNPARGPHGSQDQLGSFGLGQALFCSQRRPEVQNSLWTNSKEVWCEDADKRLVYLPEVRRGDVSARTIDKTSKVLNAINRRIKLTFNPDKSSGFDDLSPRVIREIGAFFLTTANTHI